MTRRQRGGNGDAILPRFCTPRRNNENNQEYLPGIGSFANARFSFPDLKGVRI